MPNTTLSLPMFQDDKRPLPLIVSDRYGFRLQHVTLENDVIIYSLQDWVIGLTGVDAIKASQILREFKKQLRSQPTYFKRPSIGANGKTYQMDYVEDMTLYQFAAYARATKDRPQIKDVKDFLAAAGVMADIIRQDTETAQSSIQSSRVKQAIAEGKSPAWINTRELGVITRQQFTEALQRANPEMHIGEATNGIYTGTLGANAAGLRKQLGIGEKQNPRDHMSEIALIYTMASEAAVRAQLAGYKQDDILPTALILSVIKTIAKATGKQAQEMALLIGIDLVTGRSLLGGAQ